MLFWLRAERDKSIGRAWETRGKWFENCVERYSSRTISAAVVLPAGVVRTATLITTLCEVQMDRRNGESGRFVGGVIPGRCHPFTHNRNRPTAYLHTTHTTINPP